MKLVKNNNNVRFVFGFVIVFVLFILTCIFDYQKQNDTVVQGFATFFTYFYIFFFAFFIEGIRTLGYDSYKNTLKQQIKTKSLPMDLKLKYFLKKVYFSFPVVFTLITCFVLGIVSYVPFASILKPYFLTFAIISFFCILFIPFFISLDLYDFYKNHKWV